MKKASGWKKVGRFPRVEMGLLWHTGLLPLLAGMLMVCIGIVYVLNTRQTLEYLAAGQETAGLYEEDPESLEEDLQEESRTWETGEEGLLAIENPLRYYRDLAAESYFSCLPAYSGMLSCESGLFLFPVLWGIFGTLAGALDEKNHMVKYWVSLLGKRRYAGRRLRTLILTAVAGTLWFRLFCLAGSILSAGYLQKALGRSDIFSAGILAAAPGENRTFSLKEEVVLLGILLLLALVFSMAGLFLGTLTGSSWPGCVFILGYLMLPLPSGGWDLMNAFYELAHRHCRFQGIFHLGDITAIPTLGAVSLIILFAFLPAAATLCLTEKRSAYR